MGVHGLQSTSVEGVLQTRSRRSPRLMVRQLRQRLIQRVGVLISRSHGVPIIRNIFLVSFKSNIRLRRSHLPRRSDLCLRRIVSIVVRHPRERFRHPLLGDVSVSSRTMISNRDCRVNILPVSITTTRALLCHLHLLQRTLNLRNTRPQIGNRLNRQ